MKHPELRELVEHVDGELAPWKDARVREHLAACEACRAQVASLAAASDRLATELRERTESESGRAGLAGERAMLRAQLASMSAGTPGQLQPRLRWARALGYAAVLVVLTGMGGWLWREQAAVARSARALPNPALTPGATRQVSLSQLCSADDDEVVRSVPAAVQQRVFQEYGVNRSRASDFEVDYLITPGLGGSEDVANLWPQPHASKWNSYVKDQLEDHLHHMVCRGQLPLEAAQRAIASNWIDAYKLYFKTEQPLARVQRRPEAVASLQRTALLR